MTIRTFAIVPAMVLTLGAATALAQPAARPFAQFDQAVAGASNAAYIGDGSNPSYLRNQQLLTQEPGYSIGASAAWIGDGSNPSFLRNQQLLMQQPGYSIGTGAAQVSGF